MTKTQRKPFRRNICDREGGGPLIISLADKSQ